MTSCLALALALLANRLIPGASTVGCIDAAMALPSFGEWVLVALNPLMAVWCLFCPRGSLSWLSMRSHWLKISGIVKMKKKRSALPASGTGCSGHCCSPHRYEVGN